MKINLFVKSGTAIPADGPAREQFGKFPVGEIIQVEYKPPSTTGSQAMLATWMVWMTQTAVWMTAQGMRIDLTTADGVKFGEMPIDQKHAHAYFTGKWLGSDSQGKRLSWKRSSEGVGETIADTGQRHHALSMHDQFCTERGIAITIPVCSEYRDLMKRMDS